MAELGPEEWAIKAQDLMASIEASVKDSKMIEEVDVEDDSLYVDKVSQSAVGSGGNAARALKLHPDLKEAIEKLQEQVKTMLRSCLSTNTTNADVCKILKRGVEDTKHKLAAVEGIVNRIENAESLTFDAVDMEKLAKEAEDRYAKVEAELGGKDGIATYMEKSMELQNEVKRRLGEGVAWRHDIIVHHLGLNGLITIGRNIIKPVFDSLVKKIAEEFAAEAMIPPVKGPERAGVKVRTRYGGDASQLSDIVRATLKFRMGPNILERLYGTVERLVFMKELNGAHARVTLLADRYQRPFPGGLSPPRTMFQGSDTCSECAPNERVPNMFRPVPNMSECLPNTY